MGDLIKELSREFDEINRQLVELLTSYRRGIGMSDEEEEDIIKQLELEVKGKAEAVKSAFATRKDSHNNVKNEYANVKKDHERVLLMATGVEGKKVVYRDTQREKLEAGIKRLKDCERIIGETEEIASSTIEELGRNREVIAEIHDNKKKNNSNKYELEIVNDD